MSLIVWDNPYRIRRMTRIFISYSHKDEEFRKELELHLAVVKRRGAIDVWTDCKIGAGDEFDSSILRELDRANIVLLLVSPDFLASDYCYNVEMDRAMKRHHDGTTRVIPVILRPCLWRDAPLAKLLVVPRNGDPITIWPNRDEAFLDVVQQIKKVLESAVPEKLVSEVEVAAPSANSAIVVASAPDQAREFACSSPASVSAKTVTFDYSTNDGKLSIDGSGKFFDMKFSKANATSIHLYRSGATRRIAHVQRAAIDLPTTMDENETSSRSYTIQKGEGFLIENEAGDVLAARIIDIQDDTRGADRDEINFLFTIFVRGTHIAIPSPSARVDTRRSTELCDART